VDFNAFQSNGDDRARRARLAVGYVAALFLMATVLVVGAVFGREVKRAVLDEEVDVKFAKQEAPKAPPPPPPPPPKPVVRPSAPAGPAAKGNEDGPPKELPKELPRETDVATARTEAEYDPSQGRGDPNGVRGGKGGGGALDGGVDAAPESPPTFVAEPSTPPIPLSRTMPAYPEEARRQGIEAVVVVKFTVTEEGAVDGPSVLRGHPLFDAPVLDAVRSWTFRPATLEGRPFRVRRLAKIPFSLRTQ
jgi:protein TonB